MLHHNWHIGFDYAGEVGVVRNALRGIQVIETNVPGSARRYGYFVRADGLFVGEEKRDSHVSVLISGVQNAHRLMTDHLRLRTMAPGWYVALRNRPSLFSNWFHDSPACITRI